MKASKGLYDTHDVSTVVMYVGLFEVLVTLRLTRKELLLVLVLAGCGT